MTQRICRNCGEPIPENRQANALYCSDSCKARYSEKKKTGEIPQEDEPDIKNIPPQYKPLEPINVPPLEQPEEQPKKSAIENLRGLVDGDGKQPETKPEQQQMVSKTVTEQVPNRKKNLAYFDVEDAKRKLDALKQEYNNCQQVITNAKNDNGTHPLQTALLSGLAGAVLPMLWQEDPAPPSRQLPPAKKDQKKGKYKRKYNPYVPPKRDNTQNIVWGIVGLALGGIGQAIVNDTSKAEREKKKQEIIAKMNQRIKELNPEIEKADTAYRNAHAKWFFMPDKITIEKQIMVLAPPGLGSIQKPPVKSESEVPDNAINSLDLKMEKGRRLNFMGEWEHFFGKPAILFHAVIHGLPGEGKSTFAIMLAKYLADNFGRVMYISAEEGKGETFIMKLDRLNARSKYLDFPEPDINRYEAIKKQVSPGDYNFIMIDSLDTLRIDADRLKELREVYPDAAFITISQSTKDGKMRGSQEIAHDADVVVHVHKGVATTTKNRFKAKDQTFRIFDPEEGEGGKIIPINPPRNVV